MTNVSKYGKIAALILAATLLFTLAACGGTSSADGTQAPTTSPAETKAADPQESTKTADEPAADAQATVSGAGTLVVYFSATGTTRGVAQSIASVTGADLYEITAAEPYTADDLNWNDSNSRTTHEQNDPSVRPAIASETISLSDYSVIFIGYPIWWGEEPRIMDTFVESYDFSGKTLIPFCTSGGSGIGSSGENLASNAGSGNWLEGKRLSGSSDIDGWIDDLDLP